MRTAKNDDAAFIGLSAQLLGAGECVRFHAAGTSMAPAIRDGDLLTVGPLDPAGVQPGDIILFQQMRRPIVHRVARILSTDDGRTLVIARGDAKAADDAPIEPGRILGKIVAIERRAESRTIEACRVMIARLIRRRPNHQITKSPNDQITK